MKRKNLTGLTKSELEQLAVELGLKPFNGRQIFKWLYHLRETDINSMTDISKDGRAELLKNYEINKLSLKDSRRSKDGTEKFLFALDDGKPIETVLIPDDDSRGHSTGSGRRTACISSQAGCAVGCHFCATGTMGLLRDLTVGEIVGQLMFLRDMYGDMAFSNVVMMGMGEPLLNFKNVVEAIRIMTDKQGLNISPKSIVLSTSGITPKIEKLADEKLGVRLALSLHAATQQKRRKVMPIADTFKLANLINACRYYAENSRQPVTFEYIVFEKFNDTRQDIEDLSRLMNSLDCKINVMAYNPVPGLNFKRPSQEAVNRFGRELNSRVKTVTVRKSRGRDIEAACGQLAARKYIKRKKADNQSKKGKMSAQV